MYRKEHIFMILLSFALITHVTIIQTAAQSGGTCSTPSFGAKTDFQAENGLLFRIATADFNLDGKLDLAVTNNGVSVLLGAGNGSFGAATHFPTSSSPLGIVVSDFNTDGKPDLATANRDAQAISLLLGNGSGGFSAATNFPTGNTEPGNTVLALAAGDFNGDGKSDLAITNWFSKVSILLGNGAGGFGAPTNYSSGIGLPGFVATGDFNQDGKVDLVLASSVGGNIAILLGDGNGGLGAAKTFSLSSPQSLTVADFNLDGKSDLVAATGSGIWLLLGDGTGNLGTPTSISSSGSWRFVTTGDFNADNRHDLAVANATSGAVTVLLGNGSGGFSTPVNYVTGSPIGIVVNDFNADSKPDLAIANESIGLPKLVSILLNTCGSPKLEVTPTNLDFGTVNTGQTKDLNLTVRNIGNGTLTVNTITSSNPNFSVTAPSVPFNVAAGAQQAVAVRFAPTTVGNLSGSLSLASNDPSSPTTVSLIGVGGDPCASSITPTTQSFQTLGGTGSVTVTIANGCAWTATSNANWLSITSGASGVGTGPVNYSVAANLTNATRTGTLTIAGKTFTITQTGCGFSLATSTQSFISSGGTGSIKVSTISGCAWTATSNASWLTITAGANGSGDGEVKYSVATDPANGSRTGTLTIAGQLFTVLQGTQASGWVQVESGTTNDLRGVHFLNESTGWVAGLNATLLRTANGGTNWIAVSNTGAPAFSGFLTARMVNANSIWVGGSYVYGRTLDGGVNWRGSFWNPGVRSTHSAVVPLTLDEALAVGPGVPIRYSLDAGFTTVITMTSSPSNLNDLYAIDADRAWAVGDSGRIYRITDARSPTTFTQQTSGTTQTLNAVFMLDENTGWVVGNGGTILKTTNGGVSWTAQTSSTTAILRDVHFVNAEQGWAVGDGGLILTTTNGGSNWTTEASGVTANLYGIYLISANAGYIVGGSGVILRRLQSPVAASVSGASYTTGLAPEAIASLFGLDLALDSVGAASLPLPTTLAGTNVKVKDSAGDTRAAPLFYVSPTQINYLIPVDTKKGTATVTVTSGNGNFAVGTIEIASVAPGIFAANQDGKGVPAGFAIHVKPNGEQTREALYQWDAATMKQVPKPIDLGPENEMVNLELYGTGIRHRSAPSAVTALIGGLAAIVEYADKHPEYVGLDQVNLKVPRALLGRGEVDVLLTVDGKVANIVKVHLR